MQKFESGNGTNEYDEIYDRYSKTGFKFNYSKKRIGKSKTIFEEEMSAIENGKRNEDDIPLFVYCKACNTYMDFIAGIEMLGGKWTCPSCGSSVREKTIYNQLSRENSDDTESFEDYEPECCQACGGPWPDCEASCKLFDD